MLVLLLCSSVLIVVQYFVVWIYLAFNSLNDFEEVVCIFPCIYTVAVTIFMCEYVCVCVNLYRCNRFLVVEMPE